MVKRDWTTLGAGAAEVLNLDRVYQPHARKSHSKQKEHMRSRWRAANFEHVTGRSTGCGHADNRDKLRLPPKRRDDDTTVVGPNQHRACERWAGVVTALRDSPIVQRWSRRPEVARWEHEAAARTYSSSFAVCRVLH